MWYQNIGSTIIRFVTKHACDGQTDRITTPKTALALLHRAVKAASYQQLHRTVEDTLSISITKINIVEHLTCYKVYA